MLTAQEELQLATFHLWIKRQICKIQASSRQLWSQQLNWIKDHQATCIVSAEEWVFKSCLYQMPLKLNPACHFNQLRKSLLQEAHLCNVILFSLCVHKPTSSASEYSLDTLCFLHIITKHEFYPFQVTIQPDSSLWVTYMWTHPWEQKHSHQKQM